MQCTVTANWGKEIVKRKEEKKKKKPKVNTKIKRQETETLHACLRQTTYKLNLQMEKGSQQTLRERD